MAQQEKRIKHKLVCDCGAELQMTVVVTWEEGDLESTRQRIEGKEFWQHMLHCLGE
jgi:hypothetical protein